MCKRKLFFVFMLSIHFFLFSWLLSDKERMMSLKEIELSHKQVCKIKSAAYKLLQLKFHQTTNRTSFREQYQRVSTQKRRQNKIKMLHLDPVSTFYSAHTHTHTFSLSHTLFHFLVLTHTHTHARTFAHLHSPTRIFNVCMMLIFPPSFLWQLTAWLDSQTFFL